MGVVHLAGQGNKHIVQVGSAMWDWPSLQNTCSLSPAGCCSDQQCSLVPESHLNHDSRLLTLCLQALAAPSGSALQNTYPVIPSMCQNSLWFSLDFWRKTKLACSAIKAPQHKTFCLWSPLCYYLLVWRMKQQPTPVFLLREFNAGSVAIAGSLWRSLVSWNKAMWSVSGKYMSFVKQRKETLGNFISGEKKSKREQIHPSIW